MKVIGDVGDLKKIGNFVLWLSVVNGLKVIRNYDVCVVSATGIREGDNLKVIGNFYEWSSGVRVADNQGLRCRWLSC